MQTSKLTFRIGTYILAATLIAGCTKESRKARLLGEANGYFKAGDYDKARLSYLNALQLHPQNALAFERLGGMWQAGGAPLRAAGVLERASEQDAKRGQN